MRLLSLLITKWYTWTTIVVLSLLITLSACRLVDPSEALGTITLAILTSILVISLQSLGIQIYLHCKYAKFGGDYMSYGFKSDDPKERKNRDQYNVLKPDPQGHARIRYLSDKKFEIRLRDNKLESKTVWEWKGIAILTSDNVMDMAWNYIKYPENIDFKHSAGYKRIIIQDELNGTDLIIFSNDGQYYGREVLIKHP